MTLSFLKLCITRISVQRNPPTQKIWRCLQSSKLQPRTMFGTLTLNHFKCHGFKIRISIIHKSINSPLFKHRDRTLPSNFLTQKPTVITRTRTSLLVSCQPTGLILQAEKSIMKITLTWINRFLHKITEESQSRNSVNPLGKENLQPKTIHTLPRTITFASSKTLTRMWVMLFHI